VARFVADQRTMHRVPHTVACAVLGISISWFHKWIGRGPTKRAARRAAVDARVRECFEASGRTYGSPRIHADLREAGETSSVNTVADSMRRQGLAGRKPTRRRGLTRQDPKAPKFPDLVCRDFTASAPNAKWCGDITEIPTDQGKLFLATVLDLHSRRLLGCATSDHPDAELACDAIKMAAAGARWTRRHRRGDLPYGSRIYLHGNGFHDAVPKAWGHPVDGKGRFVFRQRRRGGVLLHAGTRGPVPAPLHHQSSRTPGGGGVVSGLLQHPAPAQFGGVDVTGPIRETRCRPTRRSIRKPSRFRGKPIPRLNDRREFADDHTQPPVAHPHTCLTHEVSRRYLNPRAYTFKISDTPTDGKTSGSSTNSPRRTCARSISVAAVAGPQPEDIALASARDSDRDIDGSVGDLPITDLDEDRIDEHHRIPRLQRAIAPLGHLTDYLVGDPGDGVLGDGGAVDIGEVRSALSRRQSLCRQVQYDLIDTAQATLTFLDDLRFKRTIRVTGHFNFHWPDLGEHCLGPRVITQVLGHVPGGTDASGMGWARDGNGRPI
jgi:transposase InsO family protein